MIKEILEAVEFEVLDKYEKNSYKLKVRYINNPDGSIRWFWPTGLRKPLFLKFYNIQGRKARIFAALIKLIFVLKLAWIFKSQKVYIKKINPHFLVEKQWAVFTGTVGPNRKAVMYDIRNNKGRFTKIAIGGNAAGLISNEAKVLKRLEAIYHLPFEFPQVIKQNENYLMISDVSENGTRSSIIGSGHLNVFTDLAQKSEVKRIIAEVPLLKESVNTIKELSSQSSKVPQGILRKLNLLIESYNADSEIISALGHGDCTPWNMYIKGGKPAIYDWEMARNDFTLGYDLIHFIMQQAILVDRLSWHEIKPKLYRQLKQLLTQFGEAHKVEYYIGLYFVINTAYNLKLFSEQEKWHIQVDWLLNTWNQALSDLISPRKSERELLIMDFTDFLYNKTYAVLKYPGGKPEDINEYSDIDICVNRSECTPILAYLRTHPMLQSVKIRKRSFMSTIQLITNDGGILNIDLIWQFKRKGLQMMPTIQLLNSVSLNAYGVKIPSLEQLAHYVGLFYGLNRQPIPEKYAFLHEALTQQNNIGSSLTHIYNGHANYNQLEHIIKKQSANKWFKGLSNKLNYLIDSIRSFAMNRGMIITFSGVDGAGKTTIINNVKHDIEKRLRRRVVVIRHRPSILPILSAITKGKAAAEKAAADTLPRQGTNKNVLSSLLRFAYYYVDYFIGQFWVLSYHVLRGNIVLYDRYYFDFINDARRSNINLPERWVKAGYKLLLKPDLNIFLYAKSEVILARKKELSAKDIDILTQKYIKLFEQLNRKISQVKYISIENNDLTKTLNRINFSITQKLAWS